MSRGFHGGLEDLTQEDVRTLALRKVRRERHDGYLGSTATPAA